MTPLFSTRSWYSAWVRAGSPPSSAMICLTGCPLMPPRALTALTQICAPSENVLIGAPAGPELVPMLPMTIGLPLPGAAGAAGVGAPGVGAPGAGAAAPPAEPPPAEPPWDFPAAVVAFGAAAEPVWWPADEVPPEAGAGVEPAADEPDRDAGAADPAVV